MAKASEYLVLCLGSIIGLWLFYWICRAIGRRLPSRGGNQIEDINLKYNELVEREKTLIEDIKAVHDHERSVTFLFYTIISLLLLAALILYRSGPAHLAYVVQEMPHLSITAPLCSIFGLYLWQRWLVHRKEKYIEEQKDLAPKIQE